MILSVKIRLFPTPDQEVLIWKHIGASRWIYNYMLSEQIKRRENWDKHLSAFDMNRLLTPLKKQEEYAWLNEVSGAMLQRSCSDLSVAYNNFFSKRARFPRFKSRKKARASYPVREGRLCFTVEHVHIEKLGKVKYQTNYDIPHGRGCKFINPRISHTANGKWILSFGMECENQAPTLSDKPMGIDLGVKELATVSFGDQCFVFHNINRSRTVRRLERRLSHLQRNVARKYRQHGNFEKTRNIEKSEAKVKRAMYQLANIRQNHRHQTTHALTAMLPCRVVMEDLNVSGMMKNRHLSKAIAQQGFFEFIRQMWYKCEKCGIEFIQAGRFYPSSKTCSVCGCMKSDLRLSDRTFHCGECGTSLDRDYNAAINLMRYAG